MNWFNRNRSPYTPEQLVRLVTTNDERSMLLSTSPFDVPRFIGHSPSIEYRPILHRRIEPIDPEEEERMFSETSERPAGRPSRANNLAWPRPIIIPVRLVPRDFDDVAQNGGSGSNQKPNQQSSESYFSVAVDSDDSERFNSELWTKPTYRLRCHVWSLWQKHLKDWWFFIRYPLAFGAALAYAIATVVHLARSHP